MRPQLNQEEFSSLPPVPRMPQPPVLRGISCRRECPSGARPPMLSLVPGRPVAKTLSSRHLIAQKVLPRTSSAASDGLSVPSGLSGRLSLALPLLLYFSASLPPCLCVSYLLHESESLSISVSLPLSLLDPSLCPPVCASVSTFPLSPSFFCSLCVSVSLSLVYLRGVHVSSSVSLRQSLRLSAKWLSLLCTAS